MSIIEKIKEENSDTKHGSAPEEHGRWHERLKKAANEITVRSASVKEWGHKNGMAIAAGVDIATNIGATGMAIFDAVTMPHMQLGGACIATSLALWMTSSLVQLVVPSAAIDTKAAADADPETKARLNKQIARRNWVIKNTSKIDLFAAGSYVVAGAALGAPGLIAASAFYTAAPLVRYVVKQGETVSPPTIEKGTPLGQRVKAYARYVKNNLKNNPNKTAEWLVLFGMAGSFGGLFQALPLTQVVPVLFGTAVATAFRYYTPAQQHALADTAPELPAKQPSLPPSSGSAAQKPAP